METLYTSWCDAYVDEQPPPGFSPIDADPLVSELWSNPATTTRRRISADDIVSEFLSPDLHPAAHGSEGGFGLVFRMVWIEVDQHTWKYKISEHDFNLLLDKLHLSLAHKYGVLSPGGLTILPARIDGQDDIVTCTIGGYTDSILCWTHNMATHHSVAIYCGKYYDISLLQTLLDSHKPLARHPLFPAILSTRKLEHRGFRELYHALNTIRSVQNRTRHQSFGAKNVGAASGDYASLSALMSGCASTLARVNRDVSRQQAVLAEVDVFLAQQTTSESAHRSPTLKTDFEQSVRILKHRLERLQSEVAYNSRRSDLQLTAVSYFFPASRSYLGRS